MKNCELLKEFHEKYYDFISVADTFRTAIVNRNSESPHKECNMGGSSGSYSARFKVHDNCVAIQVNGTDFSLTYYSMFYLDKIEHNIFFGTDINAEVQFGYTKVQDEFRVCNDVFNRVMSYPIQEEQYFQYLTIASLGNEEVYQYFNELELDYNRSIQIITQKNGIQDFKDVLQNDTVMKELKRHLDLVSNAYKMTNGLVL